MPGMIWVAILIESIRQDPLDFTVLMALQLLNGCLTWYEEKNAGDAIEALKQRLAPHACVKRDGNWSVVDAKSLVLGDRIKIKLGDIIPADARLGPGFAEIDQSALTGESLAVMKMEGDEVYQGAIIKRGDLEAVVVATGQWTFFGKTTKLVASVENVGNFQKIILKVTMFLMVVSTILVTIIFVVVLHKGNNFLQTLSVCVVLEVASIPIVMQVVCTCTLAVGAKALAGKKAIVARLTSIEELAGMEILCSDKTGTLTKNELTVQQPRLLGSSTLKDIFLCAGLASKRETGNQDAIDLCICKIASTGHDVDFAHYTETDFVPFDPKNKRTEATVRHNVTGETFKCTKGAPQVVLNLATDKSIEGKVTALVDELAHGGYRTLGVARTMSDGKWVMLGLIPLYDPPRDDTAETIQKAKEMNINVKMITGDHIAIGKETARMLNMGDHIYSSGVLSDTAITHPDLLKLVLESDGFAEVFPDQKFAIVKMIQEQGKRVGMTGDGVNDAPALKKADVGIAVEGATEAARAAADIILTAPGLSVIINAIYIARMIFQRMKNFIIYRIACTMQLLVFFFITMIVLNPRDYVCRGYDDCHKLPNTFCLPVFALVMITLLNDGTLISVAYDNVHVAKEPEHWNLTVCFAVAITQGGVAFISSVLLLILGLNNMDNLSEEKIFDLFGVSSWSYGEVLTAVWLKVSISDYLTLWGARTHGMVWSRKPGKLLFFAFMLATTVSTVLAAHWFIELEDEEGLGDTIPDMDPLHWHDVGFIWVFNIVFFALQEICKIGTYKLFECYYQDKFDTGYLTDSFLVFTSVTKT